MRVFLIICGGRQFKRPAPSNDPHCRSSFTYCSVSCAHHQSQEYFCISRWLAQTPHDHVRPTSSFCIVASSMVFHLLTFMSLIGAVSTRRSPDLVSPVASSQYIWDSRGCLRVCLSQPPFFSAMFFPKTKNQPSNEKKKRN